MIIRRGMGDESAVNPLDLPLSELTGMVPGFLTQQYGPLPLWAWFGGAFLVSWWLFFPSGSEYRKKKRALRSDYTGVAKMRRRRKRAASGLKQVVT